MEDFTSNIPTEWTTTTPLSVSKVTQQGRVHSGASSVNLTKGADLSQVISITGGCYYNLSLFAHGEGSETSLTATVNFTNGQGLNVNGLTISVRTQDIPTSNRSFAYYRGITIQAPAAATNATITLKVGAQGGQSLDLDDISFTVA